MIVIILLLVIIFLLMSMAPKRSRVDSSTFGQNVMGYIVCFVVVFIFLWLIGFV